MPALFSLKNPSFYFPKFLRIKGKRPFATSILGACSLSLLNACATPADRNLVTPDTSAATPALAPESQPPFVWKGGDLQVALDSRGRVVTLMRPSTGVSYLRDEVQAPLISILRAGRKVSPSSLSWSEHAGELVFRFPAQSNGQPEVETSTRLSVVAESKTGHLSWRVTKVETNEVLDGVVWGPFATTISETVGELVGVVRDQEFAIGMQGLTMHTLGGTPDLETGESKSYRGEVAYPVEGGSDFRFYTLDRTRDRNLKIWESGGLVAHVPGSQGPGMSIEGSALAMFGVQANQALDRVGEVEVAEGLPHPILDGKWARKSREGGRVYLIMEFTEQNCAQAVEYAKQGGFASLYHGHPWTSWGHFEFRKDQFPSGAAGMKACSNNANAQGIRLGAHTLTAFINTNDPYVSPTPDARLMPVASAKLVANIDAETTDIPVSHNKLFEPEDNRNVLRTVRIDNELIRCEIVDKELNQLRGCTRGMFETTPAPHQAGVQVDKLLDHGYKVVFPGGEMMDEVAQNLARQLVAGGITHIDFDGHESGRAAGQGEYGEARFAQVVHESLPAPIYNGSSRIMPWYWHMNTTINWGEPWYGGFRQSQHAYRFKNLAMEERNYMPKMLGWYWLKPETPVEDIEWLMARASGQDAGFALATSMETLEKNPDRDAILNSIHDWEALRQAQVFSEAVREELKDPTLEFHLERVAPAEGQASKQFRLIRFRVLSTQTFRIGERQPGEPIGKDWSFFNLGETQPFRLTVKANGGDLSDIRMVQVQGKKKVTWRLPFELAEGEKAVGEVDGSFRIYDKKGWFARKVDAPKKKGAPLTLPAGKNDLQIEVRKGTGNLEVSGVLREGKVRTVVLP